MKLSKEHLSVISRANAFISRVQNDEVFQSVLATANAVSKERANIKKAKALLTGTVVVEANQEADTLDINASKVPEKAN
jgi:hypothetical protein